MGIFPVECRQSSGCDCVDLQVHFLGGLWGCGFMCGVIFSSTPLLWHFGSGYFQASGWCVSALHSGRRLPSVVGAPMCVRVCVHAHVCVCGMQDRRTGTQAHLSLCVATCSRCVSGLLFSSALLVCVC